MSTISKIRSTDRGRRPMCAYGCIVLGRIAERSPHQRHDDGVSPWRCAETQSREGTVMGTEGTVTYKLSDGVAWLGLNRPHKPNAIGGTLLAEFEAAVRRVQEEARALVIFGHGSCFSAGLDLAEHRAPEPAEVFHHSRAWHAAFSLLRHGRIPVIAALHGATIGGGLELAAACHIRVADASAFFALPEGTRGIYVGGGASVYVARLLGASRVADMMLTGRVLDAAAAERAGLVHYLGPEGQAKSTAGGRAATGPARGPLP